MNKLLILRLGVVIVFCFSCNVEKQLSHNDFKLNQGKYYYNGQLLNGSYELIVSNEPYPLVNKYTFSDGVPLGEWEQRDRNSVLLSGTITDFSMPDSITLPANTYRITLNENKEGNYIFYTLSVIADSSFVIQDSTTAPAVAQKLFKYCKEKNIAIKSICFCPGYLEMAYYEKEF